MYTNVWIYVWPLILSCVPNRRAIKCSCSSSVQTTFYSYTCAIDHFSHAHIQPIKLGARHLASSRRKWSTRIILQALFQPGQTVDANCSRRRDREGVFSFLEDDGFMTTLHRTQKPQKRLTASRVWNNAPRAYSLRVSIYFFYCTSYPGIMAL